MAVCCHVDDLKVSHKEKSSIDAFVLNICKIFGKNTKFSRVKVHENLGMDMDWSQDRTMIVSMINYLQKMIDDFPDMICSTSNNYVAEYLFMVRENKDRKLLPEDQEKHLHHTVAQLLFMCMLYLPDIQPLIAFLATRVRSPDEDDLGKLKRGLKYLKDKIHVKLYLHGDSLNMIRWWVDASYGTHWY